MADIEIVYREGYCERECSEYCWQCYTSVASDIGCTFFRDSGPFKTENGTKIIPFGDCEHAKFKYKCKGWSGKRYEMEELRDPLNPGLDSMLVTLGNTEYDCEKVTLNGECIFNEYDE